MDATHAFRCECQVDLGHVLVNAEDYCQRLSGLERKYLYFGMVHSHTEYAKEGTVASVIVHVGTNLTFEQIRRLLETATDGHVMAETVDFVEQFTGERDWCLV